MRSSSPIPHKKYKRRSRSPRSRSRERGREEYRRKHKSPVREDRSRSRSRERRRRSRERYRERTPLRRDRSRSPRHDRSRDRRDERSIEIIDITGSNLPEDPAKLAELTQDERQMMEAMGFNSFGTTKGKKVEGNDVGEVQMVTKRKYRQYMNRKGGFNRPLDFVA